MKSVQTIKIGDRVYHSEYGLGAVGWIGVERIGVEFDGVGKVLLTPDSTKLRIATLEDEQIVLVRSDTDSEDYETKLSQPLLISEEQDQDEEEKHGMGAHWSPFFEDAMVIMEYLPGILRIAKLHRGDSEFSSPQNGTAVGWARAVLYLASSEKISDLMGLRRWSHEWPERNTGVASVVALSELPGKPNEFRSMFPYCLDGIEHQLELDRVLVWSGGVEAQIKASLGGMKIAFYDTNFASNRDWYDRGYEHQFVLVGFAYDACLAEVRTFTVQRTQEYFEGMAWLTGADMQPDGALDETVTTEGMVTLMPVDGWDIDDYQFRGKVKIVWGMSMLGQRAWRIRLTVMRRCRQDMPDEDIDLDVVVTERVWRGNAPPQIGQEIQGHLWLQGRLLQVCPDGANV